MNKNASFNNLRPNTIIRFQINIFNALHRMMSNCYDYNLGNYDNNSFSNYRIELKIELILSFNMILISKHKGIGRDSIWINEYTQL